MSSAPATRREDVELKRTRILEFLEDEKYDAVLFEGRAGFAWYSSGGDNTFGIGDATCAWLYITRDETIVLTRETHARRLKSEQLSGLPFELRVVPWEQSRERIFSPLCRGQKVASDTGVVGTANESVKLARLRIDLTPLERHRYREVGRAVAHAVEATARSVLKGITEADIAGELAHRLLKHRLMPLELYVAADDRTERFGRAVFSNSPVKDRCWVAAVAQGYGLCVATGRTVCFGEPDKKFVKDFKRSSMVAGACIYYSQPGITSAELMVKVRHCYDQMNRGDEFFRAEIGSVAGYSISELPLVPDGTYRLGESLALSWWPMVGGAVSCETVLIDTVGFELVAGIQKWPQLQVEISGHQVERPDLLIRE